MCKDQTAGGRSHQQELQQRRWQLQGTNDEQNRESNTKERQRRTLAMPPKARDECDQADSGGEGQKRPVDPRRRHHRGGRHDTKQERDHEAVCGAGQ